MGSQIEFHRGRVSPLSYQFFTALGYVAILNQVNHVLASRSVPRLIPCLEQRGPCRSSCGTTSFRLSTRHAVICPLAIVEETARQKPNCPARWCEARRQLSTMQDIRTQTPLSCSGFLSSIFYPQQRGWLIPPFLVFGFARQSTGLRFYIPIRFAGWR